MSLTEKNHKKDVQRGLVYLGITKKRDILVLKNQNYINSLQSKRLLVKCLTGENAYSKIQFAALNRPC